MEQNDPDSFDALMAQADSLEGAAAAPKLTPEQAAQAEAEAQQTAQAMAMFRASAAAVIVAVLKVGREMLARKLPEIREEWTDDKFELPAKTAVPLLERHFEKLMTIVGSSPEAAAFAFSCLPLALGIVSALDKSAANERRRKKEQSEPDMTNVVNIG